MKEIEKLLEWLEDDHKRTYLFLTGYLWGVKDEDMRDIITDHFLEYAEIVKRIREEVKGEPS